jgi:hypothetical protein
VTAEHISDLKELVERYPFFVPARMFLAKILQQTNSIHFGSQFHLACLYASNPRWMYYYINPDRRLSSQSYRPERIVTSGGDYFDMLTVVESGGGDTKTTLRNMAERLRSARSLVTGITDESKNVLKPIHVKSAQIVSVPIVSTEIKKIEKPITAIPENYSVDDYFGAQVIDVSEYQAKKLITERKFTEAIAILKQLNLNYPKKSVYFADQIRFLEKVIVNSKK